MAKRAKISLKREVALTARRILIGGQKLVYVLVAERAVKYPWGRSRILYIGTTRNGSARVAQSVSARADNILQRHGVKLFHARIVTCSPRRRLKTWVELERALLRIFRELYGELPKCNGRGVRTRKPERRRLFNRDRLVSIVQQLSDGSA